MNKNSNHIAVIDDGINVLFADSGHLKFDIEIGSAGIYQRADYDSRTFSHGTVCAAIIKKYAPEAELSSVKILNEKSEKGLKQYLLDAIDWCIENRVGIINLSLGTIDFRDFEEIQNAVDKACSQNIAIIAACHNRKIYTCPASFNNVFGVMCDDDELLNEGEYIYSSFSPNGIELIACGRHRISGLIQITPSCNSFAAPMITGIIHNIIQRDHLITLDEIKQILKKNSTNKKISVPKALSDESKLETPIIMIYDIAGNGAMISKCIVNKFRSNGYHAVAIAEIETDRDLLPKVVPVKSLSEGSIKLSRKSFEIVDKVYEPDIILACINTFDNEYPVELEKEVDADIRIISGDELRNSRLTDGCDSNIPTIIVSSNNSSKNLLVKKIDMNLDDWVDELYNYILFLFEG